jgi:hypothetical protein
VYVDGRRLGWSLSSKQMFFAFAFRHPASHWVGELEKKDSAEGFARLRFHWCLRTCRQTVRIFSFFFRAMIFEIEISTRM